MTTRYKTRAFIFKKKDINESDSIFSVFTEDFGGLDIFAKAIRKSVSKLRSGIGIFYLSDIEFIQGKNRKTLTDAIALKKFGNISKDLVVFKVANGIGEILDNFIKGQEKDENIFNLVNETFAKLDSEKPLLVYYYFLWNMLSVLGYLPEVQSCISCHAKLSPNEIYFSDKLGGVICGSCISGDVVAKKVSPDVIKILRLIFKKEWQIFSKLKIEPVSQKMFYEVSNNYYSHIAGI